MKRVAVVVVAFVIGSAALMAAAFAQDVDGRDDDDFVVLTGSLLVPEGQSVGTAVIFNGDATIQGTVDETLVAFNGDVEITGTVDEDVVAFNGRVTVRSGATVGGDIASRRAVTIEDGATVGGDVTDFPKRWDFEGFGWASRFAWWLGYSISTLVLGLVLLWLARSLDHDTARALDRRLGRVFGFGALWFVVLPFIGVLLLIAIVTIPLALFLFLSFGLLYTAGYVFGAIALGRFVLKSVNSRYLAFVGGWAVLRLIGLIPVIGGISWVVTTIIGLGAFWVAARGIPRDAEPVVTPPPPAPIVA